MLLANGAQVNARNNAGYTAVELAQNAQTIDVLKGAGATMPEFPEEKKNDLLIENAEKGLAGGALMALQAGADVNHKDGNSWTALHWAAYYGHEALAQGLLGAGADINATDMGGKTPLHNTAYSPEVAKVLLANGAQVNARTTRGDTPLHHAVHHNKPEVAKVLLANGAQVSARCNDGDTALELAKRGRLERAYGDGPHHEMEALLRQHGAVYANKTNHGFHQLWKH